MLACSSFPLQSKGVNTTGMFEKAEMVEAALNLL